MVRNISTEASAHLDQKVIRPSIFLELKLDTGDINVWSGIGTINFLGKDWLGLGEFGGITRVIEPTDLTEGVIKATLSHLEASQTRDIAQEFKQGDPVGREFSLFVVFFNDNSTINSNILLSKGFIGEVNFSDGQTGSLTIELVSDSTKLQRTQFFRLDDQHQQFLFPNDLGLQFVTDLDQQVLWGAAEVGMVQTLNTGGAGINQPISVARLVPK